MLAGKKMGRVDKSSYCKPSFWSKQTSKIKTIAGSRDQPRRQFRRRAPATGRYLSKVIPVRTSSSGDTLCLILAKLRNKFLRVHIVNVADCYITRKQLCSNLRDFLPAAYLTVAVWR